MPDSVRTLTVPVRPPYRLDLTATVLRRLSTNVVDVFDGHTYRRICGDSAQPVVLHVTQLSAAELHVETVGGDGLDAGAIVRRMLGTDVDLSRFAAGAAEFPWLARLAAAARGVKPPRYPSVWEAIVNAVVFQQVSIHAAAAILRRVIERYEPVRAVGSLALALFPAPRLIADAQPADLRACGLSVNKIVALRTLARAVLAGEFEEAALDIRPTADLVAHLATYKGIGPWTAAVIALRGFGRLDVFPMNDSGVARALKDLSGESAIDPAAMLDVLGPQRGMLYYHLLLGRLAARGEILLEPAKVD